MAQLTKIKKFETKEIDLMSNILYTYLKELKDDFIKIISSTIMNNFILYKQKMINKKLKSVFIIYKAKEQINLSKKFLQWNQNLSLENDKNKNNSNNYFNLNLNVGPIINNNNSNNDNNNTEKKEEKKIKNKFLRNNYNTINSLQNANSMPNMTKISLNKKSSNKKRPLSSEEQNKNNISNKHKNLFINKNFEEKVLLQKMQRNKNSAEKIDKFIKRQEIFSKNNFHKKEKIIKDNEDENKLIYTFEPKINDSLRKLYKNDNLSVGKRLYNDSIIRRNKKIEKEYNLANMSKNTNKKSFNQKKIIELYEDYNIRKENKEKLIKKIEKECGYTYVPSVLHKKNGNYVNSGIKIQYNKSKNNIHNNNISNNNIDSKKLKKNNSCNNKSFPNNKNK
jgi:hypothetical protein